MSDSPPPPSGVVMFDRTTGQNFGNSNFSAAGRDHINLNIHLATGGNGHRLPVTQTPESIDETRSLPRVQPATAHPSLLTRVRRKFRNRSRRRPRTNVEVLQEPDNDLPCLAQTAKRNQPPPGPPPPSPSSAVVLSDGSSVSSLDGCSPSSPVRHRVSGEEEVYERSLMPKGQGFPLFNPPPLDKPVRLGDFGILGQDGFETFGNLFDPNDRQEFSLSSPPQYDARRHPRKLQEGRVVASGIEDARRLQDSDQKSTNRFEFRCRETQGAVLALTSSGDLESLTPKSRNQLREYLCNHGTQLVKKLRRKHYLEPNQSLYVVTGTIKSDSWSIAVHTSPMREPYDQMVLTKREGNSGIDLPTHEWTSWGSADARCGASNAIDEDGGRVKDQCLFLRGFLLTPSPDLERQSTLDADDGSYTGGSDSSSDSSHSKDTGHSTSRKGDYSSRTQQNNRDSDHSSPSFGGSPQQQLRGSFETSPLVQPFPKLPSDSEHYYPSRCLNEALLADQKNLDLAITHDDDWRHKIRDGYFDDEALSGFTTEFWRTNIPVVSHGSATTLPIAASVQDHGQGDRPIMQKDPTEGKLDNPWPSTSLDPLMSPRATSSSAASSSSSVRAASGSYSRRPVSQLKSTRQQFSACGACRMRRVRCDLKDLAIPTSGPHPTCSNCKERGIKCVDEFADVKAVKLLRRGRRLQQVEAIYGKSADPDNNGLSHSSRLANAIPTLHDGFFSSPFWRWFCIQRPILDAAEFYSRFEYHQKGERPLGPEGSIIAMLLVTWAYSYGLNEHGLPVHETDLSPSPSASLMSDEPTSDLGTSSKPLQGAQKTKEKFGQMLHQILDLVDYHGIMRRPSLDGVRALLLLLPLLEEAKPLERLVIHDTALSQIQVLCILAPSASPSSSSSISDDAATRARLFWYAFTQEGLSAGLRGGRFNLHRDDYESFQRTIPPPAYHGGLPYPPSSSSSVTPPSLPNSHPESQVYNHLLSSSAIPLQVNTVCRKIHTVLTGPRAVRRAEEHNLIDAHGMQEIWRDLDQCWRELSIIRRNAVNDEDSASRCDTERYACAWQIFIFECHNVVRESLKQFMSAAAQSQHPPSSRPTSHSSASPFLPPDHLHLTATRKCLELLPRVIRIMQFSLTSSGYPDRSGIFSWDSGLVRDGCFYAGYLAASTEEVVLEPTHDVQTSEQDERELSPSPLTADEGVMVCLAVLSSKRWLFSKSDEREETIRMIWEARKAKRHGQGVRYGDPPYDATYSHAGAHLSSRAHDGYQAPNQSMLGAPAPHLDRPNLPTLDVLAYQRRSESMANTANGYGSHGWSSHTPPPTPQSHGWPFT